MGQSIRNLFAAASLAALAVQPAMAAAEPVKVEIDTTERSDPVSPYIYGMFIEPIRNLVDRSLWAELVDDRKFYADVVPAADERETAVDPNGPPRAPYRVWRPIGGANAVTMDRANPLAGKQSASVAVGNQPRGLVQAGIPLGAGRKYDGYVWLSGDPGAKVTVSLVWGDGADQRMTFPMPAPSSQWRKADFSFTGPADVEARLEITGTGSGAFRIDSVSIMPSDNINGWRADTTAIARSLDSGLWRLPGGNYLSNWDWHEAIGPRDRRNPMFDHAWSAIQSNDIGMDEWLDLVRILDVEPEVTVNAGLGDSNSAAELVEYLNGPADSYWGGKRAANGHPAPYGVKYWNIGNEPYGSWQIGQTTREFYMIKHREFADRMLRADPSIVLIGSGAMPDQRDPPDVPKVNPTMDDIRERFGTDLDWTYGLFDQAAGTFSGVTEHWYDRGEQRPEAPRDVELQEWVRSPANQVRAKAMQWDLYRERFPYIDDDDIFLWIDEYAYIGGPPNLKMALAYGMVLNEMLRHSDFMTGGAYTAGSATMDISPNAAVLNSTGLVFKFYGEHFGAGTIPVSVDGTAPVPEAQFDKGAEHPLTRAGSDTYPIDVVAGLSPDGKTLKISVVNPTFDSQPLDLDLSGMRIAGAGKVYTLTGPSLEAQNRIGQAPEVTVSETASVPASGAKVAPLSISLFEFPLRP